MKHVYTFAGSAALGLACAAGAQMVTGPSSSADPYVRPVTGGPYVKVVSILTVGDVIGGYRMLGIPDGMGAYRDDAGNMVLLCNHEFGNTSASGVHTHQIGTGFSGGSFVSRWVVNPAPGANFLRVASGEDYMTQAVCATNGTGGSLFTFARFCSGDLAAPSAYFNPASGNGTLERIYLAGEENGGGGRLIATASVQRIGYELLPFNAAVGAWENALARPMASDDTVVIGTSDGGANRVYLYKGTKTNTGGPVERAGLTNGSIGGIQVQVNSVNVPTEDRTNCLGSGSPVYSGRFIITPGNTGTTFLRPEDGAWDPINPRDFYFVTTDRLDNTEAGGTQIGRSRLWRMRFDDVNNVLAGGTIEALLTGNEGQNMLDNMCVVNDHCGGTRMLLQEDSGNAAHNAKTWLYSVDTDSLDLVLQSDPARFGDLAIAATAPFNVDEENSGIFDASDVLGPGWLIGCMQAHYSLPAPMFEGGQMYAVFMPAAFGGCAADLSTPYDGLVDGTDLGLLLGNWGNPGRSDLNGDGQTDGTDLGLLLGAWGPCGDCN